MDVVWSTGKCHEACQSYDSMPHAEEPCKSMKVKEEHAEARKVQSQGGALLYPPLIKSLETCARVLSVHVKWCTFLLRREHLFCTSAILLVLGSGGFSGDVKSLDDVRSEYNSHVRREDNPKAASICQ